MTVQEVLDEVVSEAVSEPDCKPEQNEDDLFGSLVTRYVFYSGSGAFATAIEALIEEADRISACPETDEEGDLWEARAEKLREIAQEMAGYRP